MIIDAPIVDNEQINLAPYAVHAALSRGRRYPEAPPQSRTAFARDRDRIIHCAAFRRLEYKTQVFVNHEGDLFRTRLTHSLEVAQIARSVARNLRLNEDLAEAIALAHDLGHTPFGHAGQDALNACMKNHGGFEHNLQSLLVVDELEERYGDFNGLNLTYETREGILKHCSRSHAEHLGELGQRFLLGQQPSLEAQLVNLADAIAYNNHDVDDGLRSGLITLDQLAAVPLWAEHLSAVQSRYPTIPERRLIYETVRSMINTLIMDLIKTSHQRLIAVAPKNVIEVRQSCPLIGFSDNMAEATTTLKQFLFQALYRHHLVMRMNTKAQRIIKKLFNAFIDNPYLLPPAYIAKGEKSGVDQPRLIAHYIAGMTDRYAMREYQRLFVVNDV